MRKIFVILLLSLFGCAHSITPQCRHTSVTCYLAAGESYPVRLVYGEIFAGEHTEAQAYIEGKWRRLVLDSNKVVLSREKTDWIVIYDDNVSLDRALEWSTKRFE